MFILHAASEFELMHNAVAVHVLSYFNENIIPYNQKLKFQPDLWRRHI